MEKQNMKKNLLKVQTVRCGNESAPNVYPIIDSHFHYDRLQTLARLRSLFAFLNDGPMSSPFSTCGLSQCGG